MTRVVVFPDAASTPRGRGAALLRLHRDVRAAGYDLVVDAIGTPRTAFLAWWSGAPVRAGFAIRGRTWAYTVTVPRSDARRPVYMRDAYLELVAAVGATTRDLSFAPAGAEGGRRATARRGPAAHRGRAGRHLAGEGVARGPLRAPAHAARRPARAPP